jgi:D-inositol-3-phosphate glycosyltransferase
MFRMFTQLGYGNRVVISRGPEHRCEKRLVDFIPDLYEGIQQFAAHKGIHYDLVHSHYWMSGIAAEK